MRRRGSPERASATGSALLAAALKQCIPSEPELRTSEQAATWLIADLLDWHRREAKSEWWEYFRLRDLTDDELFDQRSAIAGLSVHRDARSGSPKYDGWLFLRKAGNGR